MESAATAAPSTVVKNTRDEDTIKRQIHTNAVKYLTGLANKKYEANKDKPYEPPTEALIKDECKKRWQEHLDRKGGKKDVSMFFE